MSQFSPEADAQHVVEARSSLPRPSVQGKFLFQGQEKLYIRGVTYGPFRPTVDRCEYHNPAIVARDLAQMAAAGINAVRTYTVPPRWLLDLAQQYGLWVVVGLAWEQHIAFLASRETVRGIERRVRDGVQVCAGHPAILAHSIGNEIPSPIVRWHGSRAIERFLRGLYETAKGVDPAALVTYVNYPTTEYLDLTFLDLACFNVYLESQERLAHYVARLHNVVGERPLLLTELGLDSLQHGEAAQSEAIAWQIGTSMRGGCAGAFVFAWTDEWYRGDEEITDWQFGLTDRERRPKPALEAAQRAFEAAPFGEQTEWPRVSVVVCSYNGAKTIGECCRALLRLDYPDHEVIIVDDGSTDGTGAIAASYGFRVIRTERQGLSASRNTGLVAATGEIVAYTDDDAYPDPHWLRYLALALADACGNAGVGGPNLLPPNEGLVAKCVGNAPGGPVHVLLSDREAEHIPGVNMAFRKECLEAIGGFDPRFQVAGDDVDICWRLQERGWKLGFSPSAVVWHHPRGSVRDYWRQQTGYGRAEAQLERKWPEKYNFAGHFTWNGRVYDANANRRGLWRRGRIYHGTWGSAPFQSLYQPAASGWWSLVLMPEWYLLATALAAFSGLGLLWSPLLLSLPLFLTMTGLSLARAMYRAHIVSRAANALFSAGVTTRRARYQRFGLIVFLTLLQPLARLNGRLRAGLTFWRQHKAPFQGERRLFERSDLTLAPNGCLWSLWSERWYSAERWLRALESTLRAHGVVVQRGNNFDSWDLEIRTGTFTALRLLMAIEEHGRERQLLRFRMWPSVATPLLWLGLLHGVLAAGAAASSAWPAVLVLAALLIIAAARVLRETGDTIESAVLALEAMEQATSSRRQSDTLILEEARQAEQAAPSTPENAFEISLRHNGHTHRTKVTLVAVHSDQVQAPRMERPTNAVKPDCNRSER